MLENRKKDVISATRQLILQRLRAAFLQAEYRRQRERLHHPVRVPAVGVREPRPRATTFAASAGRQQLDAGHGDARARDGVATREADGGAAPRVVRAPDVPVRDAGDAHRGGLVGAPAAEAVVLVDDDAVLDVLHPHGGELDAGDGAGAALPRLDPEAVVGVEDPRVPDRDVGHAGARVVHAQAADAAATDGQQRELATSAGTRNASAHAEGHREAAVTLYRGHGHMLCSRCGCRSSRRRWRRSRRLQRQTVELNSIRGRRHQSGTTNLVAGSPPCIPL